MEHKNNPYADREAEYLAWYQRQFPRPFDPSELVALARRQWSDRPYLADALARCTLIWNRSDLYDYFVPKHQHAQRWHFAGTLYMQHPTLGALAFDMLHDKEVPGGLTVGGVEYLDRVMGRKVDVVQFVDGMLRARAHFVAQRSQN